MSTIYIARDRRSGSHRLVRVANPAEPVGYATPPINEVNGLLMARDCLGLVSTAEKLGPIGTGQELGLGEADKALEDAAPGLLWQEGYFDPFSRPAGEGFKPVGRGAKIAAKKAAEQHRFSDRRLVGECTLTVEPLSDWVFLRSVLSICLRVAGVRRGSAYGQDGQKLTAPENSPDILAEAGFRRVEPKRSFLPVQLEHAAWTIPVCFNPFFLPGSPAMRDAHWSSLRISPLLDSVTEVRQKALGMAYVTELKGASKIKFVSAVQANLAKGSLKNGLGQERSGAALQDKWLYMAVEEREGESQLELAEDIVNAFDALFGHPRLGLATTWLAEVEPRYGNLAEALWSRVENHEDYYVMTCAHCGRTIFSGTQGAYKRFCSASCRSIWNREH